MSSYDPNTQQHWLKLIQDGRQSESVEAASDAQARLTQLPGIRAVVFDVYGTLFSSGVGDISLATQDNRDALLRQTLADNQIELTPAAQGVRLDQQLHQQIAAHQQQRSAQGIKFPEVEIRSVWQDFLAKLAQDGLLATQFKGEVATLVIDYERRVNPTQPMPHLAEVLKALKARRQVMSIISNAQFYTPLLFQTYLQADLPQLGFCPKCNVWSYQELEGKPSTKLYSLAAAKLLTYHNIAAEEVLYVGNDLRNDIWPAQAVGFKTALFAGDRLSLRRRADDPDCRHIKADIELTELRQVLECIEP